MARQEQHWKSAKVRPKGILWGSPETAIGRISCGWITQARQQTYPSVRRLTVRLSDFWTFGLLESLARARRRREMDEFLWSSSCLFGELSVDKIKVNQLTRNRIESDKENYSKAIERRSVWSKRNQKQEEKWNRYHSSLLYILWGARKSL